MTFTKWQKITIGVIIGSIVLLGAYDVLAEIFGTNNATISVIITWASGKIPAIPFLFGFLMGHFFCQNISKIEDNVVK